MVKKNLKNMQLTSWACPEGCDVSKSICEHLDKILPGYEGNGKRFRASDGTLHRLRYTGDVDSLLRSAGFNPTDGNPENSYTESDFRDFIKPFGLNAVERLVLVLTYVLNWTQAEIALEEGFVGGAMAVSRQLKSAKEKIRSYYESKTKTAV